MNFTINKKVLILIMLITAIAIVGVLTFLKITQRESRFDNNLLLSKRWLEFNNTNVDKVQKIETIRGTVKDLLKTDGVVTFNLSLATNLASENARIKISNVDQVQFVEEISPSDTRVDDSGTLGNPFRSSDIDIGNSTFITLDDFINKVQENSIIALTYISYDLNTTNNDQLNRIALID